jgi:hypothetical protein
MQVYLTKEENFMKNKILKVLLLCAHYIGTFSIGVFATMLIEYGIDSEFVTILILAIIVAVVYKMIYNHICRNEEEDVEYGR